MTRKQYQNRQMAQPRPTPEQRRARYEAHLLRELARIGWQVKRQEPFNLYLQKVSA